jgi:hypothetical protein
MALDLGNLLQTYNGTAMLAAGAAEWGFIDQKWYLAIPATMNDDAHMPDALTIDQTNWTVDEQRTFMKANYKRMIAGGVSQDEALFVTLFRIHIVRRGGIIRMANRAVFEDEYSVEPHAGANWNAAENDIPNNQNAPSMARWVKRFGNAIIHAMVYGFITRGHHYKQEMSDLYSRLLESQGVDRNPGFQLPSFETLFRSSLHAFGVKPLVDITLDDKTNNKMMASMAVRFTPHAPVAGSAHISTLNATLEHMKKEQWYGAFNTKFRVNIERIQAEVATIATRPYEFHVSSRIVTGQAKRTISNDATIAFNRLSQYALGYIDYLGRKHSLSGQRAVTSKAGGMSALAETFSKACTTFASVKVTGDSMEAFLNSF